MRIAEKVIESIPLKATRDLLREPDFMRSSVVAGMKDWELVAAKRALKNIPSTRQAIKWINREIQARGVQEAFYRVWGIEWTLRFCEEWDKRREKIKRKNKKST